MVRSLRLLIPRPRAASIDAIIRQENLAAGGDVAGWPEFTISWRTRRRWPEWSGWFLLSMIGFGIVSLAWGLVAGVGPASQAPVVAVIGILLFFGCAGFVLIVPGAYQPETARWALTVFPSLIRLDKESAGGERLSREIRRTDAGALEVEMGRGVGRSADPSWLASVTGSSLDGEVSIELDNRSIARRGPLGFFRRVPVAVVLVSWWPANSRSLAALRVFEAAGKRYWHPPGVPPRPRQRPEAEP